jgi:ligand-binding sensor domain-containing protein/two-component sensor histidine kinase
MKLGLALFFTFFLLQGGAQHSFSFRNISINEGLSQSSVVDIAEDPSGFLWLATQDGLNRYDGKEFVSFQKNFDDITTSTYSRLGKLVSGKNNELWLIIKGGVIERLDLYTQKFAPFKLLPDGKRLPPASCLTIDSKNKLWIGTEGEGIFEYDLQTKKYTQYSTAASSSTRLPGNKIIQVFEDEEKKIWVLTNSGLVFLPASGKTSYMPSLSCSVMAQDKRSTLWVGTFGRGLFRKSATDTGFVQFEGFGKEKVIPSDLVIETIFADTEDRVWVGTYGKGLYLIDNNGSVVQHLIYNKKDRSSLGFDDVLSIKEDRNGGIWIGTDGGGVSYYNKQLNNFGRYANDNLPENVFVEPARSITTDKRGTVWIGTSTSGLTYINPKENAYQTLRFTPYKKGSSNYERIVSLLATEEDEVWAGTQGNGLFVIDAKTKAAKKWFHPEAKGVLQLPDHTIWCLYPADATTVWVGTNNAGLLLLDKHKGILKHLQYKPGVQNSLAENSVRSLIQLNDTLLCIGLEKKGVQFYNTASGKVFSIESPEIENFWKPEVILKCVFYMAPFLWIGSFGNGLVAYNMQTKKSFFINESHGLPNNTVYGILPGENGALWLSTNKGLCRFLPPKDLSKLTYTSFSAFTVKDGLQSNEFNTGAYYRSKEGRLFFGGIKGVNFFNPSDFGERDFMLPVFITGLMVDNKPYESDTAIGFKKTLQFPFNRNSFAFNFTAIDFVSPGRVRYYYQLKGYDKDWVDAGDRAYAAYTNLSPGSYTFTVKATNLLSSAENTTSVAIVITPPFYKRWWFVVGVVMLILIFLYAFYRYRINQLLRLQNVRNRIASDLHDDIGSTLTNISILSTLSERHLAQPEEAGKFLHRISDEVNTLGQALDDIIWSVNTKNDNLEETVARMRRYAAEIFDAAQVIYHLNMEENVGGKKLDMEKRRDLFLIYKEILNNIYKHAKASVVWIDLKRHHDMLYLEIKDDGKGFSTIKTTHRNGLKNIHSRVEKWNGSAVVESHLGKGTTIKITFPI